jgi:hypothetical protein
MEFKDWLRQELKKRNIEQKEKVEEKGMEKEKAPSEKPEA